MSKKHPLLVRTPDKINEEFTEVVLGIGQAEIDLSSLQERKEKIIEQQEIMMGRVKELSAEMLESQKEVKRKEDEEKAKQPDLQPVHNFTAESGESA